LFDLSILLKQIRQIYQDISEFDIEMSSAKEELLNENLSVFRFKLNCILIIAAVGIIGGLLPLKLKVKDRLLSFGNILSGGFFLAAGFCHMLSESVEGFSNFDLELFGTHFPAPYALCIFGILMTLFMEKVAFSGHKHSHSIILDAGENSDTKSQEAERSRGILKNDRSIENTESPHQHSHTHNMYILGLLLSVHSIIEGLALGIEDSLADTTSILVAIVSHKIFDSFALGVSLVKNGLNTDKILKIIAVFAFTTPLGIILGLTVLPNPTQSVVAEAVKAISSGTFIYIAIVEVILEEFESPKDRFIKFFLLVIGVIMMTAISSHPHGHEGHTHLETAGS